MNVQDLIEKIIGTIYGVAIGDALGAPFEHVPLGETPYYRGQPIERVKDFYQPPDAPLGAWTDDTSQTIAVAKTLHEFFRGPGPSCLPDVFAKHAKATPTRKDGQAIGHFLRTGKFTRSWSTGALMRVAPVGLLGPLLDEDWVGVSKVAFYTSIITHRHGYALFPAVELAILIWSIMDGQERVPLFSDFHSDIFGGDIDVIMWADESLNWPAYCKLRLGPLSEVPMTSGLWMLRHVLENVLGLEPGMPWSAMPSFESGLIEAVSNSFDRDTAGGVAGAILGAYHGFDAVPERWYEGLWGKEHLNSAIEAMIGIAAPASD